MLFLCLHLFLRFRSRNENFKLDSFYGQQEKNVREIFEREVMPLIPAVVNGSNATVFAYGATGSGKTFIMQVCVRITFIFHSLSIGFEDDKF